MLELVICHHESLEVDVLAEQYGGETSEGVVTIRLPGKLFSTQRSTLTHKEDEFDNGKVEVLVKNIEPFLICPNSQAGKYINKLFPRL